MANLKEKKKNTTDLINWLNRIEMVELAEMLSKLPNEHFPIVRDIIVQELSINIFDKSTRESSDFSIDHLKESWRDNKHTIINKISYLTSQPITLNEKYDKVEAFRDIMETITAFIFVNFAMGYIIMVTIFAVPKENMRFIDVTLGFVLSTLSRILVGKVLDYKHKLKKE